jgi:hypothetical protein
MKISDAAWMASRWSVLDGASVVRATQGSYVRVGRCNLCTAVNMCKAVSIQLIVVS